MEPKTDAVKKNPLLMIKLTESDSTKTEKTIIKKQEDGVKTQQFAVNKENEKTNPCKW